MGVERPDSDIPDSLKAALRGLDSPAGGWPGFEARGLAEAHLARARRRRMLLRGASLAAAAGLALAVIVIPWRNAPGPAVASGVPGDLNGDGAVDMVDALVLARAVDESKAQRVWDFTGDGAVDRADVDRLALGAVRLSGGGL